MGIVLIFSERCVEGTKYPPILDARFSRLDGLMAVLLELVEEERPCPRGGDVGGEDGSAGAPMTWTITCVSTLCISIVLFGRRDVM
jgi:hypothetical protein